MPTETYQLRTISPLFLNGAAKDAAGKAIPELRAASVRGQLRYWFRALEGARTSDFGTAAEREADLFGSVEYGSPLMVRVTSTEAAPRITNEFMLPHRSERRAPAPAFPIGTRFKLELAARPGLTIPTRATLATSVWLLLGGLGKRSRRMFGALQVTQNRDWQFQTPEQYGDAIKLWLDAYLKKTATVNQLPDYPILHPRWSRILIGQTPLSSAEEANQALFSILRNDIYRPRQDMFGYTQGGRRASPLHAQIRLINNQIYPVLTLFRSRGGPKQIDWHILDQFMNDAQKRFNGVFIWGDPHQ